MKKLTGLIIVLSIIIAIFASCKKNGESKMFFNEYVMDDTILLKDNLTASYDLDELKRYFEGCNANERIGFQKSTKTLMFSEVNRRYPIQVLRTGGYSVYRVTQGGYFYVFWVTPFNTDTSQSDGEPSVYFTAYILSNASVNLFDCVIPGVSTAKDVKELDPFFELCFLYSSGIFSYSYINCETLLEIEYIRNDNFNEYNDLVVKEKNIVSRSSVSSRYSAILSTDIP